MVFSSELFIFGFLPFFFASYYLVPKQWKNIHILLASLLFYSWGAPKFIFFITLSTCFDYFLSIKIYRSNPTTQKRLVALSILTNLSILAYMKYANFFIEEANHLFALLGTEAISWVNITLPIGISFIIFQKISYIIDVKRGEVFPSKSIIDFMLYIFMFPQLIAGPIVRYHDIEEQIRTRLFRYQDFYNGFFRFCIGLAKKILLADSLGGVADSIFSLNADAMTTTYAWLGIFCYTFQIYFDFSAYSDMAIGLARMMGFQLLENFNWPYTSKNITEFWARWHISLSRWMKEYLYIPLGGNRKGRLRSHINLWIVFLLSGLWHGANWTFLAWGAYHGFFLTLDKLFLDKKHFWKIHESIKVMITFLIIMMGWVLFRSDTIQDALQYYGYLFGTVNFSHSSKMWSDILSNRTLFLLFLCGISFFIGSRPIRAWSMIMHQNLPAAPLVITKVLTGIFLFFLSLAALCNSSFHPFLYFRF
ncbi:putative alginate O-acetylase AlgI [Candidatus Electrothrix laxa]